MCCGPVPVNESDNDVLDVDVLVQLSAGAQEGIERLQVELIGEDLEHRGSAELAAWYSLCRKVLG